MGFTTLLHEHFQRHIEVKWNVLPQNEPDT